VIVLEEFDYSKFFDEISKINNWASKCRVLLPTSNFLFEILLLVLFLLKIKKNNNLAKFGKQNSSVSNQKQSINNIETMKLSKP